MSKSSMRGIGVMVFPLFSLENTIPEKNKKFYNNYISRYSTHNRATLNSPQTEHNTSLYRAVLCYLGLFLYTSLFPH